tara:strand:+ start:82 stop:204 length:123 start_codon:yes stop_codon:yes gene_type:complete
MPFTHIPSQVIAMTQEIEAYKNAAVKIITAQMTAQERHGA